LISDKTNPFCVGGFPGPDSTKNHCYAPGTGIQYYDWNNLEYFVQYSATHGPIGNITANISQQGTNMWIVS